jgi:hypothetical protein
MQHRTTLSRFRSYLRNEAVTFVDPNFEFTPENIEKMLRGYNDRTRVTVVQERGTYTDRGFGLKWRGGVSFEERFVRTDQSSQWTHLGYKPEVELPTLL